MAGICTKAGGSLTDRSAGGGGVKCPNWHLAPCPAAARDVREQGYIYRAEAGAVPVNDDPNATSPYRGARAIAAPQRAVAARSEAGSGPIAA
jgi:hypothetical protein